MSVLISNMARLNMKRRHWAMLIYFGICLVLSLEHLIFYVPMDFEFTVSLLLAPFIIDVKTKGDFSLRYGWLSLLGFALYELTSLESTYYFACLFILFFLLEQIWGRLTWASLLLVLCSSPLATYLFKVFGFPIRLAISDWAVTMLSLVGLSAEAAGNSILLGGESFFVESACAGLKMASLTMVLSLAILTHYEQKLKLRVKGYQLLLLTGLTLGLVILANLFRVIFLILFRSPEGSASHEVIGLICLLFYCLLPLLFFIPFVLKKMAKPTGKVLTRKVNPHLFLGLCLALLCCLTLYYFRADYDLPAFADQHSTAIEVPGYQNSLEKSGATKLVDDNSLIYLKPLTKFWAADHNPLVCWVGSGYQLRREKEKMVDGVPVFFAQLQKEAAVLHTAWWFDNGDLQTNEQLAWRMNALQGGEPFALINITCASEAELAGQVQRWLQMRPGKLLQ